MIHTALLITVMAVCTMLIRFLPFLVFDHDASPPSYILWLGRVLPQASIAMLVIYCLKDTELLSAPYGIPQLLAALCVIGLHTWKRNMILSILGGTVIYMLLIQLF